MQSFTRAALPALLLLGCATPAAVLPPTTTSEASPPAPAAQQPPVSTSASTLTSSEAEGESTTAAAALAEALKASAVYFSYDSADLLPEGRQRLKTLADLYLKSARGQTAIEGHADERGTEEYNLVLGQTRAAAVRKYLENLGVSGQRFVTRSFGEARPAVEGHSEAAWAQNRRVQIIPDGQAGVR